MSAISNELESPPDDEGYLMCLQGDWTMSSTRDALLPQPAPTTATGDVWLEIIKLMPDDDPLKPYCIERRQQGIDRYGVPLQRDNGRSHTLDAFQEALDLMVYVMADDRLDVFDAAVKCARMLLPPSGPKPT